MAFSKKPETKEIDPAQLSGFLNASKDAAVMEHKKPAAPTSPEPEDQGLSFADLMPPEEKIKKFPLTIPPALHRELKILVKDTNSPSLHDFILRTLAEKVIQSKTQK